MGRNKNIIYNFTENGEPAVECLTCGKKAVLENINDIEATKKARPCKCHEWYTTDSEEVKRMG